MESGSQPSPEEERRFVDDELERVRGEKDATISGEAARLIARWYSTDKDSALATFAATGAFSLADTVDDMLDSYRDPRTELRDRVLLDYLGAYLLAHADPDDKVVWEAEQQISDEAAGRLFEPGMYEDDQEGTLSIEATVGKERDPERPTPTILIICAEDAERGVSHGVWLDADDPVDVLQDAIIYMLSQSPTPGASRWTLGGYAHFYGLHVDQHDRLDEIHAIAVGLRKHGRPYAEWLQLIGTDREDALELFERGGYLGTWDSVDEYAASVLEGMGWRERVDELPGWLSPYVQLNASKFARDLLAGGDVHTVAMEDGRVLIFSTGVR